MAGPSAYTAGAMTRLGRALGLVLLATSILPLMPDGRSFIDLARAAFDGGGLQGALFVFWFGSPFLVGLTIAIAGGMIDPVAAVRLIRVPLGTFQAQLVVVSFTLLDEKVVAPKALLGFAVVMMAWSAIHAGRERSAERSPTVAWTVRSAALQIAGLCMWLRLQLAADIHMGMAVDAALACAIGWIWLGRRRHDS
jgi:hypothetical protein